MTDFLAKITAYKLEEVAVAKRAYPLAQVEQAAREADAPRGFLSALQAKQAQGKAALIAEIKKASPSQGLIRADFDPALLAQAYQAGGAACLSVLTDKPSFQGAPEFLTAARATTSLPVLCKDFMLDPYQIVQTRLWGADCILIIMACVSDDMAQTLYQTAQDWQMDILVEVHNHAEMVRAKKLNPKLIGINNRDLHNFEVTLETSLTLKDDAPNDALLVSESGIHTATDMARLAAGGIHAYLVGESLMRQSDVTQATKALLSAT